MSFEADQALQPELGRGERLLWSGRPGQGVRLRAADMLLIPFSLMWGGFAIFWEYQVASSPHAPAFFMAWGVPFVLIGLYLIIGRFFVDSLARSRTWYGVTNQRVLILTGLPRREVKSLSLQGLHDMSLSERADHSGSITFGSNPLSAAMWAGSAWPGMGKRLAPAFDLIDDARQVYNTIREAQRQIGTMG